MRAMKKITIRLLDDEYAHLKAYTKASNYSSDSKSSIDETVYFLLNNLLPLPFEEDDKAMEIYNKEYDRVIKMLSKKR